LVQVQYRPLKSTVESYYSLPCFFYGVFARSRLPIQRRIWRPFQRPQNHISEPMRRFSSRCRCLNSPLLNVSYFPENQMKAATATINKMNVFGTPTVNCSFMSLFNFLGARYDTSPAVPVHPFVIPLIRVGQVHETRYQSRLPQRLTVR
jgi:hypothetical protein